MSASSLAREQLVQRKAPLDAGYVSISAGQRAVRAFFRRRLAVIGLVMLGVIAACALFAPWLAPYNPNEQNIAIRLTPPFWQMNGSMAHPLGTDQVGRDILSRLIFAARVSATIALICSCISGTIGVSLGLLAGLGPRRLGEMIMRFADALQAFPNLIVAITVTAVVGAGIGNLIVILSLFGWVQVARVVRGDVLSVRETEYVLASQVLGATGFRRATRHVLPNVISPVIVLWTYALAQIVIVEGSLSFLGLGVPPPTATWGSMLSDGREFLSTAWWLGTLPGVAIMIMVLAVNFVGDALRDVLDPRTS